MHQWLRVCTVDVIGDLNPTEFADMLGVTSGAEYDDAARGFIDGVLDFVQEAKAKGVQF